jgi:hypothetical protein
MLTAGGQKMSESITLRLLKAMKEIRQVITTMITV